MSLFMSAVATELTPGELANEKKCMKKIGRNGVGVKAVFLSSLITDRSRYVCFSDINRIYKQVAMSKGGFTGKGIFGSLSYIIVELRSGNKIKCSVPVEHDADALLEEVLVRCPGKPIHSREAEQKLRQAEKEERARYADKISDKAEETVRELEADKAVLEKQPKLYRGLAQSARQLRIVRRVNPSYKWLALVVLIMAAAASIFGVIRMISGGSAEIYIVLFGFAVIFLISASRVLPSARNNIKKVTEANEQAVAAMEAAINGKGLAIPARYAHPIVLDRMIRVIREGRAETAGDAFDLVKADLKALNADVSVSRKEYDEVVEIKPMFLNNDYK